MSSKRGELQRTRRQKYQNKTAFKNDLHDKSDRTKKLNSMSICEVCEHCKGVIEWKIKYRKYKALTQPKTCNKCGNKSVKKAYHQICRDCVQELRICAKCLKPESETLQIIPADPSPEEQLKLKVEMDHLIKNLSERKRRTFLRYMEKGKKKNRKRKQKEEGEEENSDSENKPEEEQRVSHTRDELLKKIEELKLSSKDADDEFYDGLSDTDDEDYDSDDLSDVD